MSARAPAGARALRSTSFSGASISTAVPRQSTTSADRRAALLVQAIREGEKLDRKLRVAVVGGGPAGACAAESLAKTGIETYLIERKLDNCKVGAPD
jgi:geranylgeranyl reductase